MYGVEIKEVINERCLSVKTWVIGCLLSIAIICGGVYYIIAQQLEWYTFIYLLVAAFTLAFHSWMGYKDMMSFVQYMKVKVSDNVNLNVFPDKYEIVEDYGGGCYKVRPYYIEE